MGAGEGDTPVRVAILGTGWGLKVQVPQFKAVGLVVHAMYSRDAKRAKEIAAAVGISSLLVCRTPWQEWWQEGEG